MLKEINKFPTWLYSTYQISSNPSFVFYRITKCLEKSEFGNRTYLLDREITIRENGTLKSKSGNISYQASYVENHFHLLSRMKTGKKKQLFNTIFKELE